MDNEIKNLLYRSMDIPLTPDEQLKLDEALIKEPEAGREKSEMLDLRRRLKEQASVSFSPGFRERVMDEIFAKENNFDILLYKLFKPLAIAASLLIAVMLSYNIATADRLTVESVLAVPDLNISETADMVYLSELIVE